MEKNNSSDHSNEQLLADVLQVGIVMLSESRTIQWWNDAAAKLLGIRPLHEGRPVTKVLKGTGIRTLFSSHIDSLTITRKVGRKTWHLSMSLRQYREDSQLLIIRDITALEHFDSMRKDFIANVSHELRTPLTVFRGYIELMTDSVMTSTEDRHMMLSQMGEQCERMEVLVKDLLLLSRLEGGIQDRSAHRPFLVASIIENIVDDANKLSKGGHEFTLSLDHSLLIYGHQEEIRSAFSNIIFNAVRYTVPPGEIKISWSRHEGRLCFSVEDNGIGIKAKHIDKITQRFYRVDQSRARVQGGGTGLGLAIVKHVLMRHDAELTIVSEPNRGSTFSCYFPEGESQRGETLAD